MERFGRMTLRWQRKKNMPATVHSPVLPRFRCWPPPNHRWNRMARPYPRWVGTGTQSGGCDGSVVSEERRRKMLKELEDCLKQDQGLGLYLGKNMSGRARKAMADGVLIGGVDRAFDMIDQDNDEQISLKELKLAFFGKDSDSTKNSITRKEFKKLFPMMRAGRVAAVPLETEEIMQKKEITPPSTVQLIALGVQGSIPFVIFGFLDNFIMIMAGDMIDTKIGAAFNLSVMASAALGNTVSDFVGQTAGGAIGEVAERIGWPNAKLSEDQANLNVSKRVHQLGSILGIVVGCLLGMLPLLFMESASDKNLRKVFQALDEDGNGVVDEKNLLDAFRLIGLHEPEWFAHYIIEEAQGPFDQKEFKIQVRKGLGWMITHNYSIDLSGDISSDNLIDMLNEILTPEARRSKEDWEKVIRRVDKEDSHRISSAELANIFLILYRQAKRRNKQKRIMDQLEFSSEG